MIPLAWLLQSQCLWNLMNSDSLNLNTDCSGILALLLRSPAQWRARLEKWRGKKWWCHAVIPLAWLFQPQCPWSSRLSVCVNHNFVWIYYVTSSGSNVIDQWCWKMSQCLLEILWEEQMHAVGLKYSWNWRKYLEDLAKSNFSSRPLAVYLSKHSESSLILLDSLLMLLPMSGQ